MAVSLTLAQFGEKYPEFKNVPDKVFKDQLELAICQVPECQWGAKQQQGVQVLLAHLLAMSPYGEKSMLVTMKTGEKSSIYWPKFRMLRRTVGIGVMVI